MKFRYLPPKIENRKSKILSGFTLLEILITIFILSIIFSMVFGSYNTVFSTAHAIRDEATDFQMGKNCMDRMMLDLLALHVTRPPEYRVPEIGTPPDPYRLVGDTREAGEKTFGRLRFTARSHLPLGRRQAEGIAEVIYYVQLKKDQDYVLRRQDNLFPYPAYEPRGEDPILCRKVRSLAFTFYHPDEDEFDTWDSESKNFDLSTPLAIRIRLAMGDEKAPQVFETRTVLPVYREKIE